MTWVLERVQRTISQISTGGGGVHLNVTLRGGAHFLRISTTRLGKKFAFRKQWSIVLENNSLLFLNKVINHLGISDQFSYPVQEFTLKNDTWKTARPL